MRIKIRSSSMRFFFESQPIRFG